MNGASHPMPEEDTAELDAAGRTLRNSAELHGQATQRVCHDALSSVLEVARDDGLGIGKAAQRAKSVAEKLAQATLETENNLR